MSDLNVHQREALHKAYELLGEHFEAFIIVTEVVKEDGNSAIQGTHAGGFSSAIGLLNRGLHGYVNGDMGESQ